MEIKLYFLSKIIILCARILTDFGLEVFRKGKGACDPPQGPGL